MLLFYYSSLSSACRQRAGNQQAYCVPTARNARCIGPPCGVVLQEPPARRGRQRYAETGRTTTVLSGSPHSASSAPTSFAPTSFLPDNHADLAVFSISPSLFNVYFLISLCLRLFLSLASIPTSSATLLLLSLPFPLFLVSLLLSSFSTFRPLPSFPLSSCHVPSFYLVLSSRFLFPTTLIPLLPTLHSLGCAVWSMDTRRETLTALDQKTEIT